MIPGVHLPTRARAGRPPSFRGGSDLIFCSRSQLRSWYACSLQRVMIKLLHVERQSSRRTDMARLEAEVKEPTFLGRVPDDLPEARRCIDPHHGGRKSSGNPGKLLSSKFSK